MTWVVFDYGGVIAAPQPERDVAAMAAIAGRPVARFRDAYWARRLAYDLAELTAEEYWRGAAGQLGRPWDGSAVAELNSLDTASWMHLRPGIVRLIEDLSGRASRTRLALLSNAPYVLAEAVAALPLARHFEHLLFSCHLRLAKPDPRCFRAALDMLGAEPADVFFTDDRVDNVAAASALGIRAIRFTTAGALRALLAPHVSR
jgi:putative hydrolase of the HAD superfamily